MGYGMYLWHVLEHKEPRCGVFPLFITLISISMLPLRFALVSASSQLQFMSMVNETTKASGLVQRSSGHLDSNRQRRSNRL